MLILPEFLSGVSCSCFLSRKWSYVPTPCILRLIGGLKNSPAHTEHFWVRIGIPFVWGYADPHTASAHHSGSLSVGISDHWLNGHKVQECSSLCDLYNHCPPACLLSSTGPELPIIPHLVKPMLDPFPLTHVCLHLFVSCMPFLGDPSHRNCCIVLSPAVLVQNVQGSHTQCSFISWFLSWNHTSLPVPLSLFVPCVFVLCSQGSSANFSSTLWSSLPG